MNKHQKRRKKRTNRFVSLAASSEETCSSKATIFKLWTTIYLFFRLGFLVERTSDKRHRLVVLDEAPAVARLCEL
jgi:hypothetical protein